MATKELVAASAKALILSILAQGDSYGYEILQKIRLISDNTLQWKDGMLYPVLHKMETGGFVKSSWKIMENGRKRKYYSITAPGLKQLKFEREQWLSVHSALAKLWEADTCTI